MAMNHSGAIETAYKGYRFRSRLEARWAVFFDALGIEWQYEPEGFKVRLPAFQAGEQETVYRYLPDFYLPKSGTWVEVKGSDAALHADAERLTWMLDFSSPLPDMTDSDDHSDVDCSAAVRLDRRAHAYGLLLLGDIPEPVQGFVLHPIVRHHKGLIKRYAYFVQSELQIMHYGPYLPRDDGDCMYMSEATLRAVRLKTPLQYDPKVTAAYIAARSARFEHGENVGSVYGVDRRGFGLVPFT
jgi:hypothetical protein